MTIENWLSEVEECKGQNATPIPNCLFTATRLSIGARFGVYIHLLKLVVQTPYWRSASVLMPLSQLSEECRLGVRQLQRYLAELREAGWLGNNKKPLDRKTPIKHAFTVPKVTSIF